MIIENNPAFKKTDPVAIALSSTEERPPEILKFHNFNNEMHYKLAARVYGRLLQNEQIHLLSRKDTIAELFRTERERSNAESILET